MSSTASDSCSHGHDHSHGSNTSCGHEGSQSAFFQLNKDSQGLDFKPAPFLPVKKARKAKMVTPVDGANDTADNHPRMATQAANKTAHPGQVINDTKQKCRSSDQVCADEAEQTAKTVAVVESALLQQAQDDEVVTNCPDLFMDGLDPCKAIDNDAAGDARPMMVDWVNEKGPELTEDSKDGTLSIPEEGHVGLSELRTDEI
ncbi:hypothetical protein BDN71DRAFT_1506560 [Pleurotus eryngii]|uniref:Uncharacterized protein n=1 Tax=Pleurotus eryngii TaxID=5323 RepID=A0A9P6D8V0_PLEER|nr:hypothetical protein BDN71DRAFT_1506560 [Pleurotus eryngii]